MQNKVASARSHEPVRFDVLDFYRYAGAVVVAMVHFIIYYLPVALWVRERVYLFQPLMGFFFTLSGFVIMHVHGRHMKTVLDYIEYLLKRLARIYPVHLATLGLAIVWGIFANHKLGFEASAILPNVFLLHAWDTTQGLSFDYPSWSLSAEFFVYLLFPIFLFATLRLGMWMALLLPVVMAAVNTWFFHAHGLGLWTYANWNFGCLRAAPSFIAGMAAYRLATVRFANLRVPAWVAHGLMIATVPMMWFGVADEAVLAIFVVAVFLLARAEPPKPGLLSRPVPRALANCSYSFYMLHAFVGVFLVSVVPRVFHLNSDWQFGMAAVAIAATTAVSILSYRFFESPARRYLGSLPLPGITVSGARRPSSA
jgi:peptidoglycan/LPS O-acetylase OafA/YrhL